MRQIVLDTETTGLEPNEGHRIIEIGCVELVDRKYTGRHYHVYLNPERPIDQEAIQVHGITNEFLQDKPLFSEIANEFIQFIEGAELIAHNATFDLNFLNHELRLFGQFEELLESRHRVIDTLAMARERHPGQRNTLDALCKRYAVDNSERALHGALLDAQILAELYLVMTGGQTALSLGGPEANHIEQGEPRRASISAVTQLKVINATGEELAAHEACLDKITKSAQRVIWRS